MLDSLVLDANVSLSMPVEAMATERTMLQHLKSGREWFSDWRDAVDLDAAVGAFEVERPAAWHPDPLGRHELRWWDGSEWTGHVNDSGVTAFDTADLSVEQAFAHVPMKQVFIVDVANIVQWRSGSTPITRLADLDLVVAELRKRWPGCVVRGIADASLRHRIRETEPESLSRYEAMIASGEVVQAPPGTKADEFVTREADEYDGYMVTNDLYNKEGEQDLAPVTGHVPSSGV